MKHLAIIICLCTGISFSYAQSTTTPSNILCTNPVAAQILKGNYNPTDYKQVFEVKDKNIIVNGLLQYISADSLAKDIKKLGTFYNRNTGSDTLSKNRGIGAARKWVLSKFNEYSLATGNNRLITSYLQFDQSICTVTKHKNIFAVLPGTDTTDKSIIIVEGHIDSRCEGLCDTTCLAEGIEDNATGTALVMELARNMSKYSFKHTIVFLVVIAEEQGLYGANAFAQYCSANNIKIRAVLNNDVIGGVLCGKTASPPTDCKNEGEVDSTHMRIFSSGGVNSIHKALARFIAVEYRDEVLPLNPKVPMSILIMTPEDRTGRGGDHIPFRMLNYPAIRFTASHEHGDASNVSGYSDRQHSTRDTLGIDTDHDGLIDSFFVDFEYLKRNTEINGVAAAMAAMGPSIPEFTLSNTADSGLVIRITNTNAVINTYRVSVRRKVGNYNLDRLYSFTNTTTFIIPEVKKDTSYYVSVAATDSNGVESIFTVEQQAKALGSTLNSVYSKGNTIQFDIVPNPTKGEMTVNLSGLQNTPKVEIYITDIQGKVVSKSTLNTLNGNATQHFENNQLVAGIYQCSVVAKGIVLSTKSLIIEK